MWPQGRVPITVIMISLNEEHNMHGVLKNLSGWAQEVILVDSFSSDQTIDIALSYGIKVVQRPFKGFGDQWSFAINETNIKTPWTMKLDPDERITNDLKHDIENKVLDSKIQGIYVSHRLWFMGKNLSIKQNHLRLWRTGACEFSDVIVNEKPIVSGYKTLANGYVEHHDSPDLHHWLNKQNKYSSGEAIQLFRKSSLSAIPKLFGSRIERVMWLKHNFRRIPFKFCLLFLYSYIVLGAWKAGKQGVYWSRLRTDVYRFIDYKTTEMELLGRECSTKEYSLGSPDPRVEQFK